MEVLKIKKLHPDAHVPTRAHDTDAGMDLYALPVEYTDEEKKAYKSVVDQNVTAAKFLDLFGGTGIFGDTLLSEKQKAAIDIAGNLTDSEWDDYFKSKIVIMPHETKMIPSGIAIAVPTGYMGCIYARSGLASKHGLAPANCVGIVDSDYRGEVKVALHNYSNKNQVIDVGERIAQLVIQPISLCTPVEVEELDETDRGVGGFGSSGQK
jgi:dUTP pyrophosphatase